MKSEKYSNNLNKKVKELFKHDNFLAYPKLEKITLSVGISKIRDKSEEVNKIIENLKLITGQKPITTKAKKSISSFKLREGEIIGLKITLRGKRMWTFYDKFINTTLAQIRDFSGIKKSSIDSSGNISIGIKEHLIFPEISFEDTTSSHGVSVSFSFNSSDKEKLTNYLKAIDFPLERN